jgi:hypothetical protein
VIKTDITKLNWSVAAIDENDSEKYKDLCKTIERALLKPNLGDSFRSWLEQIVEDMLVCSAGSSEMLRSGDPLRPFRMYPVDTFTIDLFPQWDGKPNSYRFAQRVDGKAIHLKASEMMYIRMNLGKNSDENAAKAFNDFWTNEVMGQGKMPILGGFEGTSVLDLGTTDDKALFIEWQRFLIEIMAIAFDISPKNLGQTKDVNRSTAERGPYIAVWNLGAPQPTEAEPQAAWEAYQEAEENKPPELTEVELLQLALTDTYEQLLEAKQEAVSAQQDATSAQVALTDLYELRLMLQADVTSLKGGRN